MGAKSIDQLRKEQFLKLPQKDRKMFYDKAGEIKGIEPCAVEKDWWVTHVLSILFASDMGDSLQFKGGTSLSKCWDMINRFSEDIDLAINREKLGYGGQISKSQINDKLRRAAKKFTLDTVKQTIERRMLALPNGELIKVTDNNNGIPTQDPVQIHIEYPSLYPDDIYITNRIILEITGRSLDKFTEKRPVQSIIDKVIKGNRFSNESFSANSVTPERTLVEKICLLHEEFSKKTELIRAKRMSRHLYDLYMMSDKGITDKALNNENLFTEIIRHRYLFNRIDEVDYNTERPGTFSIIPPPEIISQWEDDYKTTVSKMIYAGEAPSFDDLMTRMKKLNDQLNKMRWKDIPEFHPGEKTENQITIKRNT